LDARPSITTDIADSTIPNSFAAFAEIFPVGTGLDLVRDIKLSISASYHIFRAPEAPPPKAINTIDTKAINGCTLPGAANTPAIAVKTTKDITLGLSKAK
jgi:hypothetical protein